MVATLVTTKNGEYVHFFDTKELAWQYVQAFVAVNNDAKWRIVEG